MEAKQQDEIFALIARNLTGEADADDMPELKEWIRSSESNRQFFEQVRNIWDTTDRQFEQANINIPAALEMVLKRIPKTFPKRTIWYYWQRVAAVVVIPLAIGALWIYFTKDKTTSTTESVYNEVYAAYGTRSALKLADSTLVWLNSGSSLKYPDKFNKKNRQVYLVGEAYFEVKSDVSRPFIVNTSTFQVKATGTKFNILEYYSSPLSEVTLISGKVLVTGSDNNTNKLSVELKPNQHLDFNRHTGTKNIIDDDTYRYIAWKEGKLIFRNEPLSQVLNRISVVFNVDIELKGTELQDYRYRATFQDESLEEILKLLKLSSPIGYTEVKRMPLPDGSFPKKKVIIFHANKTVHN